MESEEKTEMAQKREIMKERQCEGEKKKEKERRIGKGGGGRGQGAGERQTAACG